jgi:hypothetical protein
MANLLCRLRSTYFCRLLLPAVQAQPVQQQLNLPNAQQTVALNAPTGSIAYNTYGGQNGYAPVTDGYNSYDSYDSYDSSSNGYDGYGDGGQYDQQQYSSGGYGPYNTPGYGGYGGGGYGSGTGYHGGETGCLPAGQLPGCCG